MEMCFSLLSFFVENKESFKEKVCQLLLETIFLKFR